jgi:hypothetical protein
VIQAPFGARRAATHSDTPTGWSIQAEGDYVTLSFVREYDDPTAAGKRYTTTWFDMFRIVDGKVAEHWDSAMKGTPGPVAAAAAETHGSARAASSFPACRFPGPAGLTTPWRWRLQRWTSWW